MLLGVRSRNSVHINYGGQDITGQVIDKVLVCPAKRIGAQAGYHLPGLKPLGHLAELLGIQF